jgi:tetratricopeptide (TPR) repeat protein/transcriptional regulator with XRE-family HTH domain
MQTSHPLAFGTLLRRHRIAAGLTQEELAERAGISRRSLGDMERGVVHAPRKDTVALLIASLALAPRDRTALEDAARLLGSALASVSRPVVPSAPPMVGRARELALLERQLWGEGPPLLLLAGEPGIGKTRLLHAAIPRAVAQGWCVLEGGCQRRGGHEPYAPLLGALQRYLHARTRAQLRRELAGCAWLVRLLPELARGPIEPLPSWTLPPEQERRLMVAAAVRLLSNVAGAAGTLLLLDDLQWADPDALDLLTVLVRQATEVPLRVIGAYRNTEVLPANPLGVMLADLAHAGLATHHTLAPLTPAEAGQVLAGLLADEAVAEPTLRGVVQRAGGVPFFLVSYARGLQAGVDDGVPWDLAQGIRQRLVALPLGAQRALGAAAVIGRAAERRLLAAVVADPEDELLAALDAACTAQLVRAVDAEMYQFLHDVIREVVETDLGAARRALLHRRVAEALENWPDTPPPARLAYHFSQGAVWPKALEYLVLTGDRAAAAYANQDALTFYAQAVAVCERLGDEALPTAVEVARKRGELQMLIQHPRDAIGDFERMARAARRLGDRHREGLALAYRGAAEEEDHEFEMAEATLRAALAVAHEGFDDVRQHAAWRLAHTMAMVGRRTEAETLLREAQAWARWRSDRPLQQAFDVIFTLFYNWDGRFDDALSMFERGGGLNEDRPAQQLRLRWTLALLRGGMGEYQVALTLLHQCLSLGEQIGEGWARRRALNTLGWLYGELLDHQRALEWNARGVEAAREHLAPETDPECENNARLNLADTLMALGRLDKAEEQYRAVELVARNPQPQDRQMLWRYAQHLYHSYGELWLARGDAVKALAYADDCLALAEPTTSRKNIVKGRRLRGEALLAEGRLAEAERELDTARHIAEQVGNPCQLWKTLVARGELYHAQGHRQDACAEHRTALTIVERVAAALDDPTLRETFLGSAHVQHIRQRAEWGLTPAEASAAESRDDRDRLTTKADHGRHAGELRPRSHEDGHAPLTAIGRGRASRRERQAWVLGYLHTAVAISPRAYAREMAVSVDTALIDLRELMAHGLLRAEGSTKDRRYLLRSDQG